VTGNPALVFGPLGRRLLAAFAAVALSSVLILTVAALIGTDRGLATAERAGRDQVAARLAGLHDQSLRLGRAVEDLAQLSAAEAAALSLRRTEVDLAELVTDALNGQEPRLRSAGLRIHRDIQPSVPVHADPDRLHPAVTNLLTNTARYGYRQSATAT